MTFPLDPASRALARGSRGLRVGLVQSAIQSSRAGFDARDANLARALPAIRQAAADGAKLVTLGELWLQGAGSMPWATRYASVLDGTDDHVGELSALATELGVRIAFGCVTRGAASPGDVYNSAVVVEPGRGVTGVYRKSHLANWPYARGVSDEYTCYSPGRAIDLRAVGDVRVGLHICYDIYFPEVSRAQTLLGADFLLNLAAAAKSFEAYWDNLTWARAVENASWYLMCSVTGDTPERGYIGGTRAVAPDGDTVARIDHSEEGVLVVDVDLDRSQYMRGDMHVFQTRQPELYAPIVAPRHYP